MLKEKESKERGITLIALVVTIVVLLILAGASISMLTGENGIINQAKESKEKTEIEEEKDYIKISISAIQTNKLSKGDYSKITSEELQEEINKSTDKATVTGRGILNVTYTSGRTYEIDVNKNIKQLPAIAKYVKIGDFVNYTPQTTQTSYTFESQYTGLNTQTLEQENLRWRVFNINEDTIELISEKATSGEVNLSDALGYNNGVYLLNDFCSKIYGNSSINANARSLKYEDVKNKMINNSESNIYSSKIMKRTGYLYYPNLLKYEKRK